ncbi:MAG TPA: S8 family serine peptidase [Polyangiaceae bacterium]
MALSEQPTLWNRWVAGRGLRLLLCFVLLILGAILEYRLKAVPVCTTETTNLTKIHPAPPGQVPTPAGTKETEDTTKTTCRPLGPGDPPLLLIIVLVAFLLWPDVSEVSFGVLSIKRRVEEQRAEQTEQHQAMVERISAVSLTLQTIQLQQSQAQSQSQQNQVNVTVQGAVTAPARAARALRSTTRTSDNTVLINSVRAGSAFEGILVDPAQTLVANRSPRPVRVAIVGASTSLAGILPRIRQTRGSSDSLEVYGDMNASLVALIAPDADIFMLATVDDQGRATQSDVQDALNQALVLKPELLLLAFGGSPGGVTAAESKLLRVFAERGVIVIAPAGNGNEAAPAWPANDPTVIGVGSSTTSRQRAAFSNYGPGVSLFAPGEDVVFLTTEEGVPLISQMSGTAVSAALVAGVAALLLSKTSLDGTSLRETLIETARSETGIPILDAQAAVQRALKAG